MKKRIIQKIVVFSLVLAMQAAPLSYAAEEGSEIPQENSVTLTENDGTKKDDSGDTENTGNQQTPDGSGNEEESGNTDEFENGEESGNTGEFENGTESGKDDGSETGEGEESGETEDPETEVPAVPAEQGESRLVSAGERLVLLRRQWSKGLWLEINRRCLVLSGSGQYREAGSHAGIRKIWDRWKLFFL